MNAIKIDFTSSPFKMSPALLFFPLYLDKQTNKKFMFSNKEVFAEGPGLGKQALPAHSSRL